MLLIFKQYIFPLLKRSQLLLLLLLIIISACKTEKTPPEARWLQSGNAHYADHEYSLALHDWQKAMDIQPDNLKLYRKIGRLYFNQADYHQALTTYGKLLRRQPKAWDVWLQVARIQLQLLDIRAATESYKKCRDKLTTTESFIFAGDLLAARSDFAGAEHYYQQALSREDKSQVALARLAVCLLGQHQKNKAEEIFQELAGQAPTAAEILVQMSHYEQLKDDYPQAESYLIKAISHDAENIHLRIKLAGFYFETGKQEESINVLEKILEQAPENQYARKMLAETFLAGRQFHQAESLLSSLTATEEKEIDLMLLKGKVALFNGEYHRATSLFQGILEKEPTIPNGHYFLALSFLARGMDNLGRKNLRKTLELSPGFSEAELTLADSYYQAGDFEPAMIHARRVEEMEPENFRAHLIMGNLYLAQKDFNQASTSYRTALLLNLKTPTPIFGLAKAAFGSGNQDETRKLLQDLQQNTMPTDAMELFVHSLMKEKKHHQAVAFIKRKIQKNPENHYLSSILGEIQLQTGNKTAAIKTFTRMLDSDFATRTAFLKLFILYQHDREQLKKTLLKAISRVHDFPEARIRLAQIYDQEGQTSKAIIILQEGLTITPESPGLANNLAWLYCEHQPEKINEALRLAQLAYEYQPDNPAVTDTLGWIYFKKDMPDRAEWMLKKALELAPDNPDILSHYKILQKSTHSTPKPVGGSGGIISG
ncbi:MAG: tetratricopeptide repeat protein [Pseudomonadota bacterium]|nr:tetratricopeptide repeat protein [Pseudomonadota bacterium]